MMIDKKQNELENLKSHPNLKALTQLYPDGIKNFALFIGAGLSQSAGLRGWEETLNNLLENLKDKQRISSNIDKQIKGMIKSKRYTYAAYLIKHYAGNAIFQECLEQEFDKSVRLHEDISEALRNCCYSADIRLILTTNFDRVLEKSLDISPERKMDWLSFTHKQSDRVRNELSKGSRIIFKIHGDIKDADSIILTQGDYQRLYYDRNDFKFLLARLLDSYTFLFIGFSLDDPFFSTVLDTLSAYYGTLKNKHFALLPNTPDVEIIAWEDLRGVKIISYDVDLLEEHVLALNEVLKVIENIAIRYKIRNLTFDWKDLNNWQNSGANPEIIKEDGIKVLKANFTETEPGEHSNCSMHQVLGNIITGCIVHARVKFKCESGKYGMVFIGDAGGPDPYDNFKDVKKQGNGNWQEISVKVKYSHSDFCSIFLYGNRDDGELGDFVLYKDLEINVHEPI